MITIPEKLKRAFGFLVCSFWLLITVMFFAMITSFGEANMELQIGPLISLKGGSAVLFTRCLIGLGLLMLVLFFSRHRIGFILSLCWSVWWGSVLLSAFFDQTGFSDRVSILVTVLLFTASAWFSWNHLKKS